MADNDKIKGNELQNTNNSPTADSGILEDYEIEALFAAAEKIANGEEPEKLPEKRKPEPAEEVKEEKPADYAIEEVQNTAAAGEPGVFTDDGPLLSDINPKEEEAAAAPKEETPLISDVEPEEEPLISDEVPVEEAPLISDVEPEKPLISDAEPEEAPLMADAAPIEEAPLTAEPEPIEEAPLMADNKPVEEKILTPEEISRNTAADILGADNVLQDDALMQEEDLFALLNGVEGDDDLKEIGEMLLKSDNNEKIEADAAEAPAEIVEETDGKKKKEKKSWFKKKKKDKNAKDDAAAALAQTPSADAGDLPEFETISLDGGIEELDINAVDIDSILEEKKPPKKQSFFSKIFAALTAEDEPEPEAKDENEQILDELADEDKKKAKKEKKAKKGKKGAEPVYDEDGNEIEVPDKKKAKKEKPKKEKPKKEKPAAAEKETGGKKLSGKSIIIIFSFAAALFVILFILTQFVAPKMTRQSAESAYENRDYQTYYDMLYGQKRTAKEELMYQHAEMILRAQRKLVAYEKYLKKDMRLEALDCLMQVVSYYNEKYDAAANCGALTEMTSLYNEAVSYAASEFGLDEDTVKAIALNANDVEYTRMVTAVAGGEDVTIKQEDAEVPKDEDLILGEPEE